MDKKNLELLLDLYQRLVLDYSGDQPFEQREEDRLVIGHIIDELEGEIDNG